MKRRCNVCGKDKDLEEFHKDSRKKYGRRHYCKLCAIDYQKMYRNGNYVPTVKEKRATSSLERRLKKSYGITLVEYNELIARCGNKCEICKEPIEIPYIDHDHKTGKVRGILCPQCNFGLGNFVDSIELLKAATEYLESRKD